MTCKQTGITACFSGISENTYFDFDFFFDLFVFRFGSMSLSLSVSELEEEVCTFLLLQKFKMYYFLRNDYDQGEGLLLYNPYICVTYYTWHQDIYCHLNKVTSSNLHDQWYL